MYKPSAADAEDEQYANVLAHVKKEAQEEREQWHRRLSEEESHPPDPTAAEGDSSPSGDLQDLDTTDVGGYEMLEAKQQELLHVIKKLQIEKADLESEVARMAVELQNERRFAQEVEGDEDG
eukprot:447030-Hanusia_phi.AAC.10